MNVVKAAQKLSSHISQERRDLLDSDWMQIGDCDILGKLLAGDLEGPPLPKHEQVLDTIKASFYFLDDDQQTCRRLFLKF